MSKDFASSYEQILWKYAAESYERWIKWTSHENENIRTLAQGEVDRIVAKYPQLAK